MGRPLSWLIPGIVVTVALGAAGLRLAARETPQAARAGVVQHDLRVTLDPATSRITVTDRVTLPPPGASLPAFLLNARMRITRATPAVDEVPLGASRSAWDAPGGPPTVKRYRLRTMPPARTCTLQYEGVINFPLSAASEEYTRGFRQTRGAISTAGVYLAGDSAWYPQFDTRPVAFSLEVKAEGGQPAWHVISQGSGTSRDDSGTARWTSRAPMDEIYLVGGPLVAASQRSGTVDVLVYLHQRNDALAGRYLQTGAQYIRMYGSLIGPYPYDKFALVENFWETGYGMPSFTLLGPEVIRFPFILHSSFPHEILHNWWGNSVFVDYASGNWCEGLTAYLSDHLVQEQQGQGAAHRRDTLQRYRDYVKEGRDFPLAEFRARESAATEAVGYGKALMLFHQLRRAMGDERFVAVLRRLYADYRGRHASWKDVQRVAEAMSGRSFSVFFRQWLSQSGAPSLALRDVAARPSGNGYVVTGFITQVQPGRPYALTVPIVVQTTGAAIVRDITVDLAASSFTIECAQQPLAVYLDPYFDVFRMLSPLETPPSLGQIFGEPRVLAVLPSKASPQMLAAYRSLVGAWEADTHHIEVKLDSEVSALPADRPVWFLGGENLLAPEYFRHAAFTRPAGTAAPKATTWTAVVVARHPQNPEKAIGWIVSESAAPLPAFARKLPHYGKYSSAWFEGPDAVNRTSTQSADVSPLRVDLRTGDERRRRLPPLPPDPAKPLAQLPAPKLPQVPG